MVDVRKAFEQAAQYDRIRAARERAEALKREEKAANSEYYRLFHEVAPESKEPLSLTAGHEG